MFKKLSRLLICMIVAASAVASVYASEDTEWKTEVLVGLGVYQENPVTYDSFIKSLAGFLYEDIESAGDAEVIARNTGMIEADEEYSGNSALTVKQACKLAVITLGYKPLLGSDGNYMQKAAELGIADGIMAKGDDRLRNDAAVEILYSMIEAEPMVKVYGGKLNHGYSVAYGDNLLSINREIYKVKGIMTGTEITSIYGEEYTAGKDSIAIDEISYITGTNKYDSLLGKNVVAYVHETDSGILEALAVNELPSKNETVMVDCEDITDIGDRISHITYYKTEGKIKRLNIAVSPRVIYNGKFLEEYAEDDFRHGSLELIDNNGDKMYDVIKVSAYKNIVVEAVDVRDMVIKNRYRFDECIDELDLNTLEKHILLNIYNSNGEETDIKAIKTDDILSVAQSKDETLINIYISGSEAVFGSVAELDSDENYLIIDDTEYKLSEDFEDFLVDREKTINLGKEYTFMLDYFGRIAYFREKTDNNYNVLLKVYPDDMSDEYYAVHMDMNGDWFTTKVSAKVNIDGVRPQTSLEDTMYNLNNECPQVVLFDFNGENVIKNIDKAGNYTQDNETDFCKKASKSYLYHDDDRYLQDGSDIVYLEDNAKIIVFPTGDEKNNKESYKIYSAGSLLKNNRDYTVECFNPDDFMFCDLFTVEQSTDITSANASKSLYVVTGFKVRLVDGEVLPVIQGSVDGFMNLSFIGKTEGMFDGLEIGDVINFSLDSKGMIDYVTDPPVFKLSNFDNDSYDGSMGSYAEDSMHVGRISDIDYEEGKMMLSCDGVEVPFRLDKNMQVTVYYADKEECESKPVSALSRNDGLLIRCQYRRIAEIVCYKN